MKIQRLIYLLLISFLSGCISSDYKITYNTEPVGVSIICNGKNEDYSPVTLNYSPDENNKKIGAMKTVPCVLGNYDIPKYIQATNTAFKALSNLTSGGVSGYLNFINDPDNKSPITQILPISSKITSNNEDSLKQFVRQYVGVARIMFSTIDRLSRLPHHIESRTNVISVDYAEIRKNTSKSWQIWHELAEIYTAQRGIYCYDGMQCKSVLNSLSATSENFIKALYQPNPNHYSIVIESIVINNAPNNRIHLKIRGRSSPPSPASEFSFKRLNDVNRLHAIYTYRNRRNNKLMTIPIIVEIPDMLAFYKDNNIIPTEGIANVFAEYLNTEISAIPPIPLRIEKKIRRHKH